MTDSQSVCDRCVVLARIVCKSSMRGDQQQERARPVELEETNAQSACRGITAVLGGQFTDQKVLFPA